MEGSLDAHQIYHSKNGILPYFTYKVKFTSLENHTLCTSLWMILSCLIECSFNKSSLTPHSAWSYLNIKCNLLFKRSSYIHTESLVVFRSPGWEHQYYLLEQLMPWICKSAKCCTRCNIVLRWIRAITAMNVLCMCLPHNDFGLRFLTLIDYTIYKRCFIALAHLLSDVTVYTVMCLALFILLLG